MKGRAETMKRKGKLFLIILASLALVLGSAAAVSADDTPKLPDDAAVTNFHYNEQTGECTWDAVENAAEYVIGAYVSNIENTDSIGAKTLERNDGDTGSIAVIKGGTSYNIREDSSFIQWSLELGRADYTFYIYPDDSDITNIVTRNRTADGPYTIALVQLDTEISTANFTYYDRGAYKNNPQFIDGERIPSQEQGGEVVAGGISLTRDDESGRYLSRDTRTYDKGSKITLSCVPASGFRTVKLLIDGEEVDAASGYELNMDESHNIHAFFEHPLFRTDSDSLSVASDNMTEFANAVLMQKKSILKRGLEGWTWLEIRSRGSEISTSAGVLKPDNVLADNALDGGAFYSFELYRQYDYYGMTKYDSELVGDTGETAVLSVTIPEEMRNHDKKLERRFFLVYLNENGAAPEIIAEGAGNTLRANWSKSGIYLLGYKDSPASGEADPGKHTIFVRTGSANGNVSVNKSSAAAGETVIVTILPYGSYSPNITLEAADGSTKAEKLVPEERNSKIVTCGFIMPDYPVVVAVTFVGAGEKALTAAKITQSAKTVKRGKAKTVNIKSNSGSVLKISRTNKLAKKTKYVKIKTGKTIKITFKKKAPKGKYTFKVTSPAKGKFKKTTKTITIRVK